MKSRILLIVLLITTSLFAQKIQIEEHFKNIKSSDLLILGSFHFANPQLDSYKPKHTVNIFSEKRQKELRELLDVIKKYAPTKIGVEWKASRQKKLDSLYNAYLAGDFKLKSNEIYQVAFRLGKELGHKKLYAVDAPSRNFKSDLTKKEYKDKKNYYVQKAGSAKFKREMEINDTYFGLYEKGDKLKTEITLIDYFKIMNNPDVVSHNHGHYLIGEFKMGESEKGDYFGADNSIWWYSRNLRIFQNILNINKAGEDKVFVLMGAGHLPILNFLAKSSVDFNLKSFEEITKQ
ncbi:DUF5694 domain-containing protein [uncultured Tenacibaculum sp.]|uniref:DUF5694 domain-containing protein n=1 Tax=uncultured Tenacibaculum sp. TaxID=174713 RepID=UPI00260FED58|nr:DUF5694 domain-containing protein [uncultured Tenacibaculum sp.]